MWCQFDFGCETAFNLAFRWTLVKMISSQKITKRQRNRNNIVVFYLDFDGTWAQFEVCLPGSVLLLLGFQHLESISSKGTLESVREPLDGRSALPKIGRAVEVASLWCWRRGGGEEDALVIDWSTDPGLPLLSSNSHCSPGAVLL